MLGLTPHSCRCRNGSLVSWCIALAKTYYSWSVIWILKGCNNKATSGSTSLSQAEQQLVCDRFCVYVGSCAAVDVKKDFWSLDKRDPKIHPPLSVSPVAFRGTYCEFINDELCTNFISKHSPTNQRCWDSRFVQQPCVLQQVLNSDNMETSSLSRSFMLMAFLVRFLPSWLKRCSEAHDADIRHS